MKNPFKKLFSNHKLTTVAAGLGLLTKKSVLSFGKYKGLTVKNILKKDPGYICWVHDNTSHKFVRSLILDARKKSAEERLNRSYDSRGGFHGVVDYDYDDYYISGGDPVDCGGFW